jgi:hypothetical protein
MVKSFAIVLLATFVYAGAARAHGGGAEPMPGTNYTDMPPYHPTPPCRAKRSCAYLWHHQLFHQH